MTTVAILIGYGKINERLHNSARSFLDRGCKVQTYLWDRGVVDEPQRTSEEEREVAATYIGTGRAESRTQLLINFLVTTVRLYRRLVEDRVDVLHAAHLILLPLALFVKLRTRVRVIYDPYEFHAHTISERLGPTLVVSIIRPAVYAVEGFLVRFVDGVVTIDSRSSFLSDHYAKCNSNVSVILNVPERRSDRPDEYENASDLHEPAHRSPTLLYVGGLTVEKGALKLPPMLAALRREVDDARLLCVGRFRDGSRDEFWRSVEELGQEQHVEFVPWVPASELSPMMESARVGVAPYEESDRFLLLGGGNGRKLFMFMKHGLPVLAPRFGEVGRIVSEAGAAILVDTSDIEGMAEVAGRLMKDDVLWRKLSVNGVRAIETRYNWNSERDKLIEVYENAGVF